MDTDIHGLSYFACIWNDHHNV